VNHRSGRKLGTGCSDIRPVLELEPKTPLPLALVIGKATEFDPQRRYQTPGDMLADLKIAIRRVKEGADNEGAKQSLESQEGLGDDGQPRKIMVVEADVKRQDLLRDLFKKNGYRVLVSSDPQRAIERFRSDAKAAELVVFCSGAFGRDAVEMFNQFGEDKLTSSLPAVLLLDEAHGQWSGDAKISPRRQVVVMPVKLKELRHAIRQVIQA
jgi:eukaryotic-like serine/threonine-protein kinase